MEVNSFFDLAVALNKLTDGQAVINETLNSNIQSNEIAILCLISWNIIMTIMLFYIWDSKISKR
jgi:hypothetical protein